MTQAFSPSWVTPVFSPVYIPDLPSLSLSEAERHTISRLQMKMYRRRQQMLLSDAYYDGEQVLTNLGIALPPELDGLRVIMGWPKIAVDPFVERLGVDSFRVGNSTKPDDTLTDLMIATDFIAQESLVYTDALVLGRSWCLVSTNETDAYDSVTGVPSITIESPLNISADWDTKTGKPNNILQSYWENDQRHAALHTPDMSIYLAQDDYAVWQLVRRDVHNFGYCPGVRVPNRPRAAARDGRSEISTELMSITDAACRTLLNLTAAGEFYSVPQKLILGATEEDFISSDGTKKTAWETYIGRVLALQRDSEGALPEVKQLDAYDPSVFTKVIEMYASQAAGIMGAPPQDLGLYTTGNPVSAESLQVSEARRDRRTKRMHANFGCSIVDLAQLCMRWMNKGALPKGYDKLAVDWRDPAIVNFTGMADGISKLAQEGVVPRQSDVLLRKLGFSAIERRQMLDEMKANPTEAAINELATSVEGKQVRLANALVAAGRPEAGAPGGPADKSAAIPKTPTK